MEKNDRIEGVWLGEEIPDEQWVAVVLDRNHQPVERLSECFSLRLARGSAKAAQWDGARWEANPDVIVEYSGVIPRSVLTRRTQLAVSVAIGLNRTGETWPPASTEKEGD